MAYKARDDACGHSSWEGGQAKLSFGKVGWLGWHKFRWHLLTSANINAETSACLLNHWFEHLTNEHVEENKVIRTSFGWIYKAGPILSPVRRTCLLGPFFSTRFWGPPCKGMQSLKPSARNYVVPSIFGWSISWDACIFHTSKLSPETRVYWGPYEGTMVVNNPLSP